VATHREAIIFHFDPLAAVEPSGMSSLDRHEYFKRLTASAENVKLIGYLDDDEVRQVVTFLKTLSFE
jgi:hypothetical protein